MAMESLLFLFETVSSVGKVLNRGEEKNSELQSMVLQVQSISESVKDFARSIPEEERDDVFNSNPVWRQIWEQVKSCEQVISKHAARVRSARGIEDQAPPDAELTSRAISSVRKSVSGVARSSRGLLSEAFEALSSALGDNLATVLRLPEDELSKIRQASEEMGKLQLNLVLAIQVYAISKGAKTERQLALALDKDDAGTKRRAPPAEEPRPLQARRLSERSGASTGFRSSDDNALSSRGSELALTAGEIGSPEDRLLLQLVSDEPRARSLELPMLTTQELRLAEREATMEGSSVSSENYRYLLGRTELKDKLPKLYFPGSKNNIARYISRDAIVLEVPPATLQGTQDDCDKATLMLGQACTPGNDDATLPWGSGSDDLGCLSTPRALAYVTGLIKQGQKEGVHLQKAGETRWHWIDKGVKEEVRSGDRIALIVESPPGSCEPGPPEDLDAHQVVCLLGLELQQQL